MTDPTVETINDGTCTTGRTEPTAAVTGSPSHRVTGLMALPAIAAPLRPFLPSPLFGLYRPTMPMRPIIVSKISSMAVTTRAAAAYAC